MKTIKNFYLFLLLFISPKIFNKKADEYTEQEHGKKYTEYHIKKSHEFRIRYLKTATWITFWVLSGAIIGHFTAIYFEMDHLSIKVIRVTSLGLIGYSVLMPLRF